MANVKKAKVLRLLYCDFCGESQESATILVQGREGVHICVSCVVKCADIIGEDAEKNQIAAVEPTPSVVAVGEAVK